MERGGAVEECAYFSHINIKTKHYRLVQLEGTFTDRLAQLPDQKLKLSKGKYLRKRATATSYLPKGL